MSVLFIAGHTIRWSARVLSIVSTVVLLMFVVGEPFSVSRITLVDWLALLFFPTGIVVGFVVGWRREQLGGLMAIGSLFAFYAVFVLIMKGDISKAGWFVLFAAPGFLFVIASFLKTRSVPPRSSG